MTTDTKADLSRLCRERGGGRVMIPIFDLPVCAEDLIELARLEGFDPVASSFAEVMRAILPPDEEVCLMHYETEEEFAKRSSSGGEDTPF